MVYIKGSAKELGSWEKPGMMMDKISKSNFQKSIAFKEGNFFGFIVTTESEQYYATGANKEKFGENILDIKSDTIIYIEIYDWVKAE